MTPPSRSADPRSTRRRALRWLAEGGLGLGAFVALSRWQTHSLLDTGTSAPDFEAQDLDGNPVRLSQFFGERILLHFWATWCGVCRQEFGMLNRLQADVPAGTRIITVTTDEELDALKSFVATHELRYPILLAPAAVLRAYQVRAFPTNYFIAPTGRIAGATVGMSGSWAVRARLRFAN
jgi:peroxiredoxin